MIYERFLSLTLCLSEGEKGAFVGRILKVAVQDSKEIRMGKTTDMISIELYES